MNVKEYISSGVIESYVLGIATEAERQEFEAMCAAHPEIAAARNAFELSLEEQMLKDAPAPPVHLKTAIEEKLAQSSQETANGEMEEERPVRRMSGWKWLAAASLILLAGTGYWAYTTQQKYGSLKARNQELENNLQQSTAQLENLKKDAEMLQKPDMKMAALQGTSDPRIYSTVYWDTTTKDVYLMVNNLPKPASDKQYQLWALLNGQPIDLGLIEVKQERLLYRMKNVREAQAFAITLEPVGGSQAPTSAPVLVSKL